MSVNVRACACAAINNAMDVGSYRCICGEELACWQTTEYTWAFQHGPNPEHTSPSWEKGGMTMNACDWVDDVHERMGLDLDKLGYEL